MSARRGNAISKTKMESRERRSPRISRTKTPSVNELRKKWKVSPKGKRKLDFPSQKGPLSGKSFYLDLQGYRNSAAQLKRAIRNLDGTVEEFFHKDVSYLVTNRKEVDNGKSPSSCSAPSPRTPSPFPMTRSSSVKGAPVASPMSTDSPKSVDSRTFKASLDSRGRTMCNSVAAGRKRGTTDLLSNANTWGVTVLHIEQVLKWVSQLVAKSGQRKTMSCAEKDKLSTIKRSNEAKVPKVMALQDTYLKVEDLAFKYKPLVGEFKVWPEITFIGSVTCPFDQRRQKSSEDNTLKQKHREGSKPSKKIIVQERPKHGYCECCEARYTDLSSHLKGDRHHKFARTESNYISLDKAISEGPTIEDLLDEIRRKKLNDRPSTAEDRPSLTKSDEHFPEDINDDVFLLSSPVCKSRSNASELSNRQPANKETLKVEEEPGLDTMARLNGNTSGSVVRHRSRNGNSPCCMAVFDSSCEAIRNGPEGVTKTLPVPKSSSGSPSFSEKRTVSNICNRFDISPSSPKKFMDTIKEKSDASFTKCLEGNNGEHVAGVSEECGQSFALPNPSKTSENISSSVPGAFVADEEVKLNDSLFHNSKRVLNLSNRREELKLSPIPRCESAAGRSILSSCSDDDDFLPSGFPVYSSLGSSFGDVAKDVDFLVNKFVKRSSSQSNSENVDPNGSKLMSSPCSAKTSRHMSSANVCNGSVQEDIATCCILNHDSNEKVESSNEKVENSVSQIAARSSDPENTGRNSHIVKGMNSHVVKRKRLLIDDDEETKAKKCKRLSGDHELNSERDHEDQGLSSGYTSESELTVGFRSSVAERVKLQRALTESLRESFNGTLSSVEELRSSPPLAERTSVEKLKSTPRITRTAQKRCSVYTSSPFAELTNTCKRAGRERAKSDGRLIVCKSISTKRNSFEKLSETRRMRQPRSACLIQNDPFRFDDL